MGKLLAKSLSPKVSALQWKKSGQFAYEEPIHNNMLDSQKNL